MGMLLALLLDARGAGPVTVVEMNLERAEIARRLLPATVVRADDLGDLRAEIVIDATGNPGAMRRRSSMSTMGERCWCWCRLTGGTRKAVAL